MNDGKVNWAGCMAAILTPFTQDGALDEVALRDNIDMTVREGSHAILVGGHNGEAHLSTDAERKRTWEIATEVINGRIPLLVGTGGIRTEHVIELSRYAASLGVDGIMVEVPYFMTPNLPDIIEHYQLISDAVRVPIMVYNHPKRTGVALTPAAMVQLSRIENIVAIKDSSGDFTHLVECLYRLGDSLRLFSGSARQWGYASIVSGLSGFVDGLPQVMGKRIPELYEAAVRGDHATAARLQRQAFEVGELLYKASGTWPSTGKDAMRLQGRPGGWPRRPLRPMTGADLETLRAGLAKADLLPVAAAV